MKERMVDRIERWFRFGEVVLTVGDELSRSLQSLELDVVQPWSVSWVSLR
jgi:hypothetical protein